MKKNDVYHISYTDQYRNTHHGDLHHCFEGLAVVHEKADGGFILIDTFWGIGRTDNKCFNIDQIDKDITAELYCNLDEIEKISEYDIQYYADTDIYRLTDQHGCAKSCIYFYKRKGAQRSKDKIKLVLEAKAADAVQRIQYATSDHAQYLKSLTELETCTDLNNFYI